jgi:hypothetical protein
MKHITKNNMTVKWEHKQENILFEMRAPTKGWVAIGFNNTKSLKGTYLLMGRVRKGKAEVVEHYVEQPGVYKPISNYGVINQTSDIEGIEEKNSTIIRFSLPIHTISKYKKQLTKNSNWNLLIAYSLHDDFQHHSIMRTATNIKL